MITKLLEIITGKDDLERVASKGDLARLNAYLETRPLLFIQCPKRFLDPSTFTPEELIEMAREAAEELSQGPFEPWVVEMDGKMRLSAFSSQKKVEVFVRKLCLQMNQVFPLSCAEILIQDVAKCVQVDVIDLNKFSEQSWEICIGTQDMR